MSAVYLETSALLTWLLGESNAAAVREAVDQAAAVVTSTLTFLEAERAIVRLEAAASLRGGDAQRLRGLLARVRPGWLAMSVTDSVLARAGRRFPAEPVRTLDAIHLATALELTRAFADLRVLSLDRRITENAQALGIG